MAEQQIHLLRNVRQILYLALVYVKELVLIQTAVIKFVLQRKPVPAPQASCFQEDESKFSSDCSVHCLCDGGTLRCDRNLQCDTNAACEERDNMRKCYCNEGYTGDGQSCTRTVFTDCLEVSNSNLPDGVFTIRPTGWTEAPFQVYCNMSHGGGWTVFQRRVDASVSFDRNWANYRTGFGSAGPNENVWLGNKILNFMTSRRNYKLRVDVTKQDGVRWHMNYDSFLVNNENSNYRLELGTFTGNADYDYMGYHRGQQFSTPERDNDANSGGNCAAYSYYRAGWWFKSCHNANLNRGTFGDYHFYLYNGDTYTFHRYLQYSQMKMRPV